MLHLETLAPETLGLIRALQAEPLLRSFRLVSGTSLALQFGHRLSVDIDLFSREEYEVDAIMVQFYQQKYRQEDCMVVLRSLVYFDDVDLADWPHLLKHPRLTFEEVKTRIVGAVKSLL